MKSREDARKRKFPAAKRSEKNRNHDRPKAYLTRCGEAWGEKGGKERPPAEMRRDASSRILRRVAQRSPRSPGEALRRGALGPFEIAAMRREAPGFAKSPTAPRAPRGEGKLNRYIDIK